MTAHTQNEHSSTVRNANDIKISTRTLEFAVYVAAVLATIITAAVVGDDASENGVDVFNANDAMQYITYLTVGLMVARGLAKAGNRVHNNSNA
jgi:surface polysaccharide O-acyltransferase-like enzyme